MTDLGTLGAKDRFSEAIAIDAQGRIIGISALCDPNAGPVDEQCRPHAVLWTLKPGS